ncbi:MAG: hypothetical protein WC956_05545 [bacterium]
MHKKLISLICISMIFLASPAFAYKRDTGPEPQGGQQEGSTQQAPAQQSQASGDDYGYESGKGRGLVIAGYVLLVAGGMAAIAGSTIAAASDNHRTLGAIVGGSGAAVSLAGTLMVVFGGSSGYALGPVIDPKHETYGLALAANF